MGFELGVWKQLLDMGEVHNSLRARFWFQFAWRDVSAAEGAYAVLDSAVPLRTVFVGIGAAEMASGPGSSG